MKLSQLKNIVKEAVKEAIQEEILHFCQCMDGEECISGPRLGRRVVQLIDATNKSIGLMGQPVYFDRDHAIGV